MGDEILLQYKIATFSANCHPKGGQYPAFAGRPGVTRHLRSGWFSWPLYPATCEPGDEENYPSRGLSAGRSPVPSSAAGPPSSSFANWAASMMRTPNSCLLYTSDAADEED